MPKYSKETKDINVKTVNVINGNKDKWKYFYDLEVSKIFLILKKTRHRKIDRFYYSKT